MWIMAVVLNKITGQYKKSAHTPDYTGDDWIINPTEADIERYKFVTPPIDMEAVEREQKIQERIRDNAIAELEAEGKI